MQQSKVWERIVRIANALPPNWKVAGNCQLIVDLSGLNCVPPVEAPPATACGFACLRARHPGDSLGISFCTTTTTTSSGLAYRKRDEAAVGLD